MSSNLTSKILILDFGSQYTQVIARRIREFHVYSEINAYNTSAAKIKKAAPAGIILSGGPASVYSPKAPQLDQQIYELGIPILGICYGTQLIAKDFGGQVERSVHREYGPGILRLKSSPTGPQTRPLFHGLPSEIEVWNSHQDKITVLPEAFQTFGQTENSTNAVIGCPEKNIYGLQFHPEVGHTPLGKNLLENFALKICKCVPNWTVESFIERSCAAIRDQVREGRVLLGLSGGVDSTVAAALLHQAIGDQLTCIFVDNGLLRAGERSAVKELFADNFHIRLKTVDASKNFISKLKGVTEPERKRRIIGNEFVRVFQNTAQELQGRSSSKHPFRFLAQGTLYPDVIESVSIAGNPSSLIKSHHNVGGLPSWMKFELVEPLRQLFKDEVREVGLKLGLSKELIYRQPFPGPGLAVRILGEVTRARLRILREADTIVIQEMKSSGWYYKVWQSFAVLLPVRSVGVMGDERTYENTIALRMVESRDGMTADWVRLPYELLAKISSRIMNEVKGVNRVCYDISSKPPATIEWE
ncbi:MAG: GMP synthase (glutamine-hydrolyzing) [Verrucomicrobia bacterium]|nr:MAG: GMP synthase (glutamine-hydrolyzing) [Verrucomicrobiota bacterium]